MEVDFLEGHVLKTISGAFRLQKRDAVFMAKGKTKSETPELNSLWSERHRCSSGVVASFGNSWRSEQLE